MKIIKQFFSLIKKLPEKWVNFAWIFDKSKGFRLKLIFIVAIDVTSSLLSILIAMISRNVINGAQGKDQNQIATFLVAYLAALVVNLGIGVLSSMYVVVVNERFNFSIRRKVFDRIMRSKWIPISKFHSGDLLTRLTSDVNAVSGGITSVFPSIISLVVRFVGAFAALMASAPSLAVSLLIIAPVTVIVSRTISVKLKVLQKKVQETEAEYRSFMQETTANLTIVKSFTFEDASMEALSRIQDKRMKLIIRRNRVTVLAGLVLNAGILTGSTLAFIWGVFGLFNGTIMFGDMTMFMTLVQQVQGPIMGLAGTVPMIIAIVASAERIRDIEAIDKEERLIAPLLPEDVAIRAKDVSCSYDGKTPVLSGISFDLQPHDVAAILGTSGVGKTTLIRAVLALIQPDSGAIEFEVDGIDYPASVSIREMISYVPQGNTLFSGTVADNLRMGCPEASDEEIVEALRVAAAYDFVKDLPDGVNTIIGERGAGLSEGQAQRVSIARAIIKKSPVLILDEATSALDEKTELRVLEGIKSIEPRPTCLIITHRSSVLPFCTKQIRLGDIDQSFERALEESHIVSATHT